MKKLMTLAIMVTCLFLTSYSASYAVTPLSLNGNDYQITAFCKNNAGDYCSQGDIIHDTFIFSDNHFIVDSFNNGVLGVGDSGDFTDNGMSFTASYKVITGNSLDKYTFDVKGINLIDIMIFGRMNIVYYQLGLGGYDQQDTTTAFFLGIKK